jgi:polar amino acid transport system substrate-binding protein
MLRKNIKLMWLMVVLISISMLFIGCSQKQADSLDRVNKAGSISFAMSGGYPPFNYYNDENELVGFDVDVCKEVAKRLDVEFEPITTEL